MADVQESTKGTITPVLTDYLRIIDDPAGTPLSKNVLISALATLLQTSYDARYLGTPNIVYTTSNFSKTSDTTLANVTGLSFSVEAGGIYRFSSNLYLTCGASGGAKAAISGTCTATLIKYTLYASLSTEGLSLGGALATALGTSIGATQAYTTMLIHGVIQVANAGTLTVQFAQNASNATASTVYALSTFECFKIA